MKDAFASALLGAHLILRVLGGGVTDFEIRGLAREQSLEQAWGRLLETASTDKSPVQRVVALLKDMKAQLESEAGKESEMYDKMVCWCETNEKSKTKAIADGEAKISDLESAIAAQAAKKGKLSTNIAALKKQIAADDATLKEATAIREAAAATFNDEEKDLMQAATNLANAIRVLSRHHGGDESMLQLNSPILASVRSVLRDASLKYDLLLGDAPRARFRKASSQQPTASLLSVGTGQQDGGPNSALLAALGKYSDSADDVPVNLAEHFLARSAHDTAGAFVQAGDGQGGLPTAGSYTPASSSIFGILTRMKDEFEANLNQMQKDELKAREEFEALKQAKMDQIAAGKEQLDEMEGEHGSNAKALSDSKEDLELTSARRSEDVEFLRNLRLTCQDLDNQWEKRSATRGQETKAVAEAIAILTEDDAREHLAKSVTFFQDASHTDSEAQRVRRSRAAAALRRAADSPDLEADDLLSAWHGRQLGGQGSMFGAHDPRGQLSTLAVSVELDNFKEVKAAMDKMVADLKAQQEEEVQAKATCGKELKDNEKMTYTKTEEKEDLEAKLATLAAAIEKMNGEIENAKTQIAKTKVAIQEASQTREKDNAEFQTIIADQRAAQGILQKALTRLGQFYKSKAALVQQAARASQTPPAQFTDYKSNAGSVSVMGLLEQIIEDSKQLEAETTAGEQKDQAEYETFVKDSNGLVAQLTEEITSKTKLISAAKVDSEETSADHESTVDELESLAAYKADLHTQCDFLLKNFDIRQKGRLQEIEAIGQAKAFLSGASEQ